MIGLHRLVVSAERLEIVTDATATIIRIRIIGVIRIDVTGTRFGAVIPIPAKVSEAYHNLSRPFSFVSMPQAMRRLRRLKTRHGVLA